MVVGSSGAVVELCWWGCSSWAVGPGWARSPLPQPRGPSVLRSTPAARGRGKRPPTEVAANVFGVSRGIVCLEGCWCEHAAWLHAFNSVSPLKKQNIYIKKKKGAGHRAACPGRSWAPRPRSAQEAVGRVRWLAAGSRRLSASVGAGGAVGGLFGGGRLRFQSLESSRWAEPAPAPASPHPMGRRPPWPSGTPTLYSQTGAPHPILPPPYPHGAVSRWPPRSIWVPRVRGGASCPGRPPRAPLRGHAPWVRAVRAAENAPSPAHAQASGLRRLPASPRLACDGSPGPPAALLPPCPGRAAPPSTPVRHRGSPCLVRVARRAPRGSQRQGGDGWHMESTRGLRPGGKNLSGGIPGQPAGMGMVLAVGCGSPCRAQGLVRGCGVFPMSPSHSKGQVFLLSPPSSPSP